MSVLAKSPLLRAAPSESIAPVSLQQQRFWLLDQLTPNNPAYNIAVRWGLSGPLDIDILRRAISEIVRRHQVLRTRFELIDGQPMQIIEPSLNVELPVVDLRPFGDAERTQMAERLTVEEAQRPFDLTRLPLMRAALLRLRDSEAVLLVTTHHIVSDGWSVGVFVDELAALYEALAAGAEPPLAPLPFQYAEYAAAQRKTFAEGSVSAELSYFKSRLKNLPLCEVPTDRPRPPIFSSHSEILSILLPKELTGALGRLSAKNGVTLYMTAVAALELLLRAYLGHDDIVIGTPVTGRDSVDSEALIGIFINLVVLRTDLGGDPTFLELMRRVRETVLGALANQSVPFEVLVDTLSPRRDFSRTPLFQVNFIYQRAFVRNQTFAGITLTDIPSRSAGALYDLNFFMVERIEGWRASCEYNTDLYEAATVERMLAQFRALLEAIVANPERRLSEFPLEIARGGAQAAGEPTAAPAPAAGAGTPGEVESTLAEWWMKLLGLEKVGTRDNFFDVGGTSLSAVALFAKAREQYGVDLRLATILEAPTIEAQAQLIREQQAPRPACSLVTIQPRGSRPPLFLVHGIGGSVLVFNDMIKHLEADRPLYGIEYEFSTARPELLVVENLAAQYVAEIQKVQPHGPYHLLGYSFGGTLAFEIARQLRAANEEVALLGMLDSSRVGRAKAVRGGRGVRRRLKRVAYLARFHLGRLAFGPKRIAYVREELVTRVTQFLYAALTGAGLRLPKSLEDGEQVNLFAATRYRPSPYSGRITLFRAVKGLGAGADDLELGWRGLADEGVEVRAIPGTHFDLLREPNVRFLALKVTAALHGEPDSGGLIANGSNHAAAESRRS
jgi:thioesterase domain-containing protein/aryl carrier-like protein